ncbi:uncharacterized protein L199_003017 [Kwoniella botswanensis]|uniref:uncharacterized protein n=1 Tax=Kwoniella botswanensis TaxID=1268659 RepID=UPI00315DA8C2
MSTSSEGTFRQNLTVDDNGRGIGATKILLGGNSYTLKDSTSVGPEVLSDLTGSQRDDIVTIVRTQEGGTKYIYRPSSHWTSFDGEP